MADETVVLPAPAKVRFSFVPVMPPDRVSVPAVELIVVAPPSVMAPERVDDALDSSAPAVPPTPVPLRESAFARASALVTSSVAPLLTVVAPVPRTLLLPETDSVPAVTPMAPVYALLFPLRRSVPASSFEMLPAPLIGALIVRLPVPPELPTS